jgi:medium-chain acyl-[acyl-carrier-protein] hydrolase
LGQQRTTISVPAAGRQASPWLVFPRENRAAPLRLFCFPYAGGTALTYRNWPDGLPPGVEVCAVQLPGRGNRFHEKPFGNLRGLVGAVAPALAPFLDRPFAFFGHSMGAMIAFELARHLRREYGLLPAHLFVSGRRAPHLDRDEAVTYNLSEADFIDSLRDLNGTPPEVLAHRELMQLMVPLLRADFAVCQTYSYTPEPPLGCPLTAFGGLSDREVSREQLGGWREQTSGAFVMRLLPGDHFFLDSAQASLLGLLSHELNRIRPA